MPKLPLRKPSMQSLVSIFIYGFLLDGVLSVASGWLPILALRSLVAGMVLCLGLLLYVLAAFAPGLPKRLILPAVFLLVWVDVCGGFPLAFVVPDHFQTILAWAKLILSLALVRPFYRWRRTLPKLDAPVFSWPAFASIAIFTVLAAPLVLAASALNAAGTWLEAGSGGYVKLRPEGLVLEEREWSRNGQRVRLVSMIHIGEKGFYDAILASMPKQGSATVLLEGVTDDKGLLKSRFSYSKIAGLLGLSAQEASAFQHEGKMASRGREPVSAGKFPMEYRRADIDISEFQPLTLEFMNAVGAMLSDPTAATVLRTFRAPDSPLRQPGADETVMSDIIGKRNEHLVAEIDRALASAQTVVVPWGALHLPFIEASLKERGFQETGRVDRTVVHFWPRPAKPAEK